MLEALTGFLSGLKQASPALLLGFALASGLMLFTPDSFVATLGLDAFRHANKPYIGGTFVVSLAILLAQSLFHLGASIKSLFAKREARRKAAQAEAARHKELHELTPDEKAYLVPYIFGDENTQYFLIEDGVAGGLTAKRIIYQASKIGSIVDGWAFNIQPWAKAYLKANPELLEGANPNPEGPPRW